MDNIINNKNYIMLLRHIGSDIPERANRKMHTYERYMENVRTHITEEQYMVLRKFFLEEKPLDDISSEMGINAEKVLESTRGICKDFCLDAKMFYIISDAIELEAKLDALKAEYERLSSKINSGDLSGVSFDTSDNLVRDILQENIADLIENNRAKNCLRSNGIETVYDLTKCTWLDLFHMRNMGISTLACIKEFADSIGLKLPEENIAVMQKVNEYMTKKRKENDSDASVIP